MDIQRLKDLVDRFSGSALEEMRLSMDGMDIAIRFAADTATSVSGAVTQTPAMEKTTTVQAPMAGLVYLSPAPGAEPFVSVGQSVEAGQTLVLIEAMKSMIPLTAPIAGTVAAIDIDDGATCRAGQVLLTLFGDAA